MDIYFLRNNKTGAIIENSKFSEIAPITGMSVSTFYMSKNSNDGFKNWTVIGDGEFSIKLKERIRNEYEVKSINTDITYSCISASDVAVKCGCTASSIIISEKKNNNFKDWTVVSKGRFLVRKKTIVYEN